MKPIGKFTYGWATTIALAGIAIVVHAGDIATSGAFMPTMPNKSATPGPAPKGMARMPGG